MITPDDIHLVETCGACPEQYDALKSNTDETIGYLRLRHGMFVVTCPNVGGESVYVAYPEGDGVFETNERDLYLDHAKAAIADWYNIQRAQVAVDEWNHGDSQE